MNYEIGKFYRVPCVHGVIYEMERDWPVIGPKHEDAEFVNFPHQHYHVDWRFVGQRDLERIRYDYYGVPLMEGARINQAGLPSPAMLRRKCVRAWKRYPYQSAQWLAKLEVAYADCKLKEGLVCPHRGIPLQGCPTEGDVVTCPGHGLRWNVKTGALVPLLDIGGPTNPTFLEWMMGFPTGWTDVEPSVMPSSLKSSKSSAGQS